MAIENVIGGGANAGLTETGISAAGTAQATATQLKAEHSEVTTVASGAGVILSSLFATGQEQTVFNATSTALKVYPPSGFQINSLVVNSAITLAPQTGVMFKCISTSRIFGVLSA